MVKCFFGGPTFVAKILPCHALTAEYQFKKTCELINTLEGCGAKIVCIINDNNKVNQSFFNTFHKSDPAFPWIAKSPVDNSKPLFLLYDTVHFIKNIRNNWVSEKSQTLDMPQLTPTTSAEPSVISAKWTRLSELYAEESKTIVKLSQLTKSSVSPSNIEKQKVSLALNVFSEKTSSALKSSAASNLGWQETAVFIDHVLRLWKVFNTKTVIENIRMRDPDRCAVDLSSTGQKPLEILEFWADCAAKMKPQGQRIKTFTKETWMTFQRLSLACLVTRRCLCFLLEITSLLNIPISRGIHHKCL
ncbi:transposable element p transposase [Plakobranchus ocellatus]|uniref:Transposable element p transposase n=1 Tax=Plakobranchus ocellatus TaxID=259542 RepID=A0AAV4BXC5_9GAST|nr:transposable element p transposase [Plakobranchus ocellatus]